VTDALNAHFSKMTSADWLSRHTAVSEEDFVKEPMRNKLNIVISRTIHLASHMGQMLYLRA
jgi:dihydrofolate reductase